MNILPFIYNIIYLVELFPVALVPLWLLEILQNAKKKKKKEMCLFFTDGKQKTLWGVKSGS